ncbi:hypothetical protein FB451DRAFT_1420248 [Mycena latifolia]|nr:hypothetical protein FB451DRAFT_1420248 [Mycena latifolia]
MIIGLEGSFRYSGRCSAGYAGVEPRLSRRRQQGVGVGKVEMVVVTDQEASTLRTLELGFCAVDDGLFKAFTYDPNKPSPSFSLPQLTSLTVTEGAERVNGGSVAHMIESVCASHGRNAAFPALSAVHLWAYGPKFNDDIEARITAACATGLVVDDIEKVMKNLIKRPA